MKSSIAFLLATVVLAVQGSTIEWRRSNNGGHQGNLSRNSNKHRGSGHHNNNGGGGNNNNNNGGNNSNGNSGNSGGNNSTGTSGNSGGGNSTNPQDSLTLDPSVICTACTDNGQNPPVPGQAASLTSSNNFINFCQGKTLTNGQQLVGGSCNGVVYGDIIPSSNMPAAKISFPPNNGRFPANQNITFTMNIENMVTGNFVNANTNYYGAPQQLQNNIVIGHSHVVVQALPAIDSTTPLDPQVFAFFKGINTPAANGVLSVVIANGLPAGAYRFCTINTDANHVPVLVAIAQHGSVDDCIYATAVDNGSSANSTSTGSTGASSNATSSTTSANAAASSNATSSTTSAAAASSSNATSSTTSADAAASSNATSSTTSTDAAASSNATSSTTSTDAAASSSSNATSSTTSADTAASSDATSSTTSAAAASSSAGNGGGNNGSGNNGGGHNHRQGGNGRGRGGRSRHSY